MSQLITIKGGKEFSRAKVRVCAGGAAWDLAGQAACGGAGGRREPTGAEPGAPSGPGGAAGPGFVCLLLAALLQTPSAAPALTPKNLVASPGLCFLGVTALGRPGSLAGPSWVPHPTPPPAPAPYPRGDRGQRQPASRGRRAAPNRPREPRENPGGSREIQPRSQRPVPPRPPPRGARRTPAGRPGLCCAAPRAARALGSNPRLPPRPRAGKRRAGRD